MRVLSVGTDFPPGTYGGYELQCAGAVRYLRAHGHEVEVLTSRGGPAAAGLHRELVAFPVAPEPTSELEARRAERHNAAVLAARIAAGRPGVVSWWRLGELSMSLVGRVARAGIPAVGMVCDPWMLDGPARDPWARRTGAGPDLRAARWLFVSRALREQVRGTGEVVPAGIEPGAWPVAPAQPWGGRLLCAGRLSRLKGVDTALDALAHLGADVRLAIAGPEGDPAYAAALRARADGRVTFEPARAPEAMAARYAEADAVLFPVRWPEPFGLVPLEAMAVGRPVVASGTGGSAEYLRDGVNALVCGRDDPAALAAAIRRLAADPRLRARLVEGGRRTAAAHPAERSHAAVQEALERAAREARLAARL